MTQNEKLELILAYEVACTRYLAAFMEKYDLSCDPEPWVGNEVGTIAEVGDYFFDFQDIKRCIDEDVEWQDLIEWYDYNIEVGTLGLTTINLKSWLKGAPRVDQMRIEEIKAKRKELEELIEETKKDARK
jgi:hypothetical protein